MDLKRLETTPFQTAQTRRRRNAMHVNLRRNKGAERKERLLGASMLVKIGVCAAALILVLVMEMFVFPREQGAHAPAAEANAPAATDGGMDETLGRLRFVDGGGLVGVFASGNRWHVPVDATNAALLDDARLLQLQAEAGSAVSLSAGGEVRAVGADSELGDYVRIYHGEDLESVYYHLSDICVEPGQPLLLGDTLGKVAKDGTLYLRIYRTGAPQEVETYVEVPDYS